MRHYEEYEVVEKKQKLVKIACDRCGEEIPKNGLYEDREFELEFKKGRGYPDGGYMEGWEVCDLCDDCIAWLKDMLESNGVTVSPVEIDW